ncbi:hypothetical protein PISMIDRAFT_172912 [Pisolithus microcarpus 441]|uniref:Uncharacterized protein n=1 Tax=Pisolithus microcarpus 441 TaxID=765257 RepID=A0A0C9YYA4_9AGAM|nr:hypothetical protein PISMIDRAFT_467444 [Pisolithus microcarpus 441]KIK18884.1 hypothetical protein PISMIDRAFT_172912 [Pisolithus microcarpus 441]
MCPLSTQLHYVFCSQRPSATRNPQMCRELAAIVRRRDFIAATKHRNFSVPRALLCRASPSDRPCMSSLLGPPHVLRDLAPLSLLCGRDWRAGLCRMLSAVRCE